MAAHEHHQAVRCGFCPGAPAGVQRVARGVCGRCAARVLAHRATCPDCQGVVIIDVEARNADGHQVTVAFCTACEFTVPMGTFLAATRLT